MVKSVRTRTAIFSGWSISDQILTVYVCIGYRRPQSSYSPIPASLPIGFESRSRRYAIQGLNSIPGIWILPLGNTSSFGSLSPGILLRPPTLSIGPMVSVNLRDPKISRPSDFHVP